MRKITTFLIFFIGVILLSGCERNVNLTPKDERLALIHGNLLHLYNKTKLHGSTSDSIYTFKRDSILKSYKLSKLEFETEVNKLEKDPYKWKFFIAKSLEAYDEFRD